MLSAPFLHTWSLESGAHALAFWLDSIVTQLIGIVAIGVFVSVSSAIVWYILKLTVGIRAEEEDEVLGLDKSECGMEAYPEFGGGSRTL